MIFAGRREAVWKISFGGKPASSATKKRWTAKKKATAGGKAA